MSEFTFELEPFKNEAQRGYRGIAGPYGDAMAFFTTPTGPHQPKSMLRAQLVSEHLPEAHVDGIGMGGRPSTYKATLEVAGITGTLKYNSFGLTKAARALHIAYQDRAYVYAHTKTLKTEREIRRPGVHIVLTGGRSVPGLGHTRKVTARGDVDEIDLAIAIVFEAVVTDPQDPAMATFYGLLRSSSNSNG